MNDQDTKEVDSAIKHKELLERLNQVDESKGINPNFASDVHNISIEHTKSKKRSFRSTFTTQFRAIILKNFALQAKQRGTNICQVLTPIICLLFTLLIKALAENGVKGKFSFELNVPFLHNIPYDKLYGGDNFLNLTSGLNFTTCEQWYLYQFQAASQDTVDYVGNDTVGMLSEKFPPIDLLRDQYNCSGQGLMPYFAMTKGQSIDQDIYDNLKYLNTLDFNFTMKNASRVAPELSRIPDGAVTFYEANNDTLTVKIQINDIRVYEYHRINGVTRYLSRSPDGDYSQILNIFEGQLILMDLISKAYIQNELGVFLMSGTQVMSQTTSGDSIIATLINLGGASLYPIALALLLPVFMQTLVLEKEERLREIMKMSGMQMTNYWIVNYIWSFGLYMISALVFVLFGRFVLRTEFFTDTNLWIMTVILLGWGLSQVSLAFFYQNFFGKAKSANLGGYLISLWTVLAGITYSLSVYPKPQLVPLYFRIYPSFAFARLIYYLSLECSNFRCLTNFSEINDEMWSCISILYGSAIILLLLGLYLEQVIPHEYGIRKHPLFFIKGIWDKGKKKLHERASISRSRGDFVPIEVKKVDRSKLGPDFEDDEVAKEIDYVKGLEPPFSDLPLVIKNLRKVYKAVGGKPPKIAVNDFSLQIPKGEVFGLLGPNGAGKTTIIAMLTGLYPPEGGNAWVGGYDIKNQIDLVHTQMGVCPQFDLLWPDLTVEEHLLFYARIRGIEKKQEKALVEKAMKEVHLGNFGKFKTKQLSGGMKRRLSVALSLVGEPQIIFLDEPTTGLDPENRRQLWDILTEAKGDKAIVLTTHSMEEADVLCSRIGIITDGSMRCIGNQAMLKTKYGGGYHLFINCHKDKHFAKNKEFNHEKLAEECYTRLKQYIKTLFPNSELKSSFNGSFVYQVPLEGLQVSKVFEDLESKKEELAISDWGISQSTLEDVFIEIVEASENPNESMLQ